MKKSEMINALALRLRILHLQDFNEFSEGEMPLSYLLDKLAKTALETVEIEGMLPPSHYTETYYSVYEASEYRPNRWEEDDDD